MDYLRGDSKKPHSKECGLGELLLVPSCFVYKATNGF